MPKRTRRNDRSAPKAALLTRHHDVEKVPVSDLCNEQELQPSLFYA